MKKSKFKYNQIVRISNPLFVPEDKDPSIPQLGDIHYISCRRGSPFEPDENGYFDIEPEYAHLESEYLTGNLVHEFFGGGAILKQTLECEIEAVLDEDGNEMFAKLKD